MSLLSAHQWFGNLVTISWWNDLWLNEGFATFMETHCTSVLFPEYDMWAQFVAADGAMAKEVDALSSTHALHSDVSAVNSDAAIDAQFDLIAYQKGGSVMRMLARVLGETVLFQGLSSYLKVSGAAGGALILAAVA